MRPLFLILVIFLTLVSACTMSTDSDSDSDANSASTPTPTSAISVGDAPLTVTWTAGGDLFAWRSSDQQVRRIASGGVIRPFIAPDGEWIAFLRGPDRDPRTLWITDTPGANERQLIDARALPGSDAADGTRRLNQIVWHPASDTIYFNTVIGAGMEARTADDLWRVDVRTGTGERLLPDGEGGQITISPDGQILALAAAGSYAQPAEAAPEPGRIVFFDRTTRARTVALEFPAVATASQSRWYPIPRWLPDSAGLRVAIPPANLVYGADDQADDAQTALWWVPVSGDATQTGTVDADAFGVPVFSADGAWIAYLQRRAALDQQAFTLMIAAHDGSDPAMYAENASGPGWLPGQALFTYATSDPVEFWLGGPGATPIPFLGETSLGVWADADTYVFAVSDGEQTALKFGLLDVPTPVQTITTLDAVPPFDAVLP